MTRPLLTSIRPDLRNGTPVTLAFCEACGTVKVFNCNNRVKFPDTGYWIECRACGEYRYFFRIERGRVVSEKKGKHGTHHHHHSDEA